MGEYGRIVGEGGGRRGGSGDITSDVMGAVEDAIDSVASLPPEALIAMAVGLVILAVVFLRR